MREGSVTANPGNSLGLVLARPSALRCGWLRHRGDSVSAEVHVLPDETGARWLEHAVAALRHVAGAGDRAVLVVAPTSCADPASIRRLVESGADDVIGEEDPEGAAILRVALARHVRLAEGIAALERAGLTGTSPAMRSVRRRLADALEDSEVPILILGETGTGKFVAAKAVHRADPGRYAHPFHSLDCGAVAEGLLGSELFGHVRGAFTGAQDNRAGAIASAGEGTLLLDEIGELHPPLQAAFLTALQERRYRRVGSDQSEPLRCRIVAATNRDLPRMVRERAFRSDLFFRLDGVRVTLPPLRERTHDIPGLFTVFVSRHTPAGRAPPRVDPDVLGFLVHHPLPGNARQLEMMARQAVSAAGEATRIRMSHLPPGDTRLDTDHPPVSTTDIDALVASGSRLDEILAACTEGAVRAAVRLAEERLGPGPRSRVIRAAATALSVSERTIYYRLRGGAVAPAEAEAAAGPGSH